jgi:predicted nucleotidyltransferase
MKKWKEFVEESKNDVKSLTEGKKQRSRGSGPGLERSLKWFLDTGPQKKGGWPGGKKRPSFRRRKFNDTSAPPGAPGGLEEEVEPESFEKQGHLEPRFWTADKLNPKIAKRLMKIANEFVEGLDQDVTIEDVRLTGSLANYNWSKYSDIDLHIVVDFSKISDDAELAKSFFDAARWRWNELHDIIMYGHEVEIFIENVGHITHSSGIYSIMEDDWVISPTSDEIRFDYPTARKKADSIQTETNLIEKFARSKPHAAIKSIKRLKQKIRMMRKAGLNSPDQEYSAENIAFKILRREETLDKLSQMQYDAYDAVLSIEA